MRKLQWFAYCFAQPIVMSAIWLCCDVTFLVTSQTLNLPPSLFFCIQSTSNGSYPSYCVIYMQVQHCAILNRRWNYFFQRAQFQTPDLLVTKNVTFQHNQIPLTKIGCAKQYANHCKCRTSPPVSHTWCAGNHRHSIYGNMITLGNVPLP